MEKARKFITELRNATHPLHNLLEKQDALAVLIQDALDPDDYRKALFWLYYAQKPIENALVRFFSLNNLTIPFEPRYPYIEMDLMQTDDSFRVSDLVVADEPEIKNLADAIGYFYVLEGSKLGAALIVSRLNKSLPEMEHHFFNSAVFNREAFIDQVDNFLDEIDRSQWVISKMSACAAFKMFAHL